MLLLDCKNKLKIPMLTYIEGLQKDPTIANKLNTLSINDAINYYDYKIPCDSWIGFAIEPNATFYPLSEITFHIEFVKAEYSIPVKHFEIENQHLLIGESIILEHPTKLVVYEMPNHLKVMLEQEAKQRDDFEK